MTTVHLSDEQQQALKLLRERQGGLLKAKREYSQQLAHARKVIREALADAPLTVPQLAEAVRLPTETVLWHLTAMRKYGEIREVDAEDDYPSYGLIGADGE